MELPAIMICSGLLLLALVACFSFAMAYGKLLAEFADYKDETKLLMDDANRYADAYFTTAVICRSLLKMTPLRFMTGDQQRKFLAMLAQGAEIES